MDTTSSGQAILYLQSREGSLYEIPKEAALMNEVVNMMLDDDEEEPPDTDQNPFTDSNEVTNNPVVPLPELSDFVLSKIVEWCKYHLTEPVSFFTDDEGNKFPDNRWDNEFLDVDKHTLFDLLLAANYLDNKKLLDLVCTKMSEDVKNLTIEGKREYFELDGPPEESESAQIA